MGSVRNKDRVTVNPQMDTESSDYEGAAAEVEV